MFIRPEIQRAKKLLNILGRKFIKTITNTNPVIKKTYYLIVKRYGHFERVCIIFLGFVLLCIPLLVQNDKRDREKIFVIVLFRFNKKE